MQTKLLPESAMGSHSPPPLPYSLTGLRYLPLTRWTPGPVLAALSQHRSIKEATKLPRLTQPGDLAQHNCY